MSLSVHIQHQLGAFQLDAQFEANAGVTAIFGRSGAGKTTLINAVAGLLKPDAGHVRLGTRTLFDAHSFVPAHKRNMGYVFQDARLFPHLTVGQNLDYAARFRPKPRAANHRREIIELMGLEKLLTRAPIDLSGGEKQRMALGRALLSRPEVLLMDEPLAALDSTRKDTILPYLERIKAQTDAPPILYVSHALDEIARLADHIVVLQNGASVLNGPIFDVLSDPDAVPLLGVRQAGAVMMAQVEEHGAQGLSLLKVSAGMLSLPGVHAPVGSTVRLRILAQDVILSRTRPEGLSTANILPVTVRGIKTGIGPGAAIGLQAGTDKLIARIPAPAVQSLQLATGQDCYALINATSVASASIGR